MMGKIKVGRVGHLLVLAMVGAVVLTTSLFAIHPGKASAQTACTPAPGATYDPAKGKCTANPTGTTRTGTAICPAGYTPAGGVCQETTPACGTNCPGAAGGAGNPITGPGGVAAVGPGNGGANGTDSDSPTLSCEILSANPINWFICPIVIGIQESVNGLNKAIDALMTIDTSGGSASIFNGSFHTAWAQFRLIGLGIVIIGGLIMLASQAFGFELLDAYTVRKVLPRLVIAIILISVSWDLMKFAIGLTNDVGRSIRSIIYQPFKTSNSFSQYIQLGDFSTFVAALVGGAAIVTLGLAALLSFVVTAGLAVLIAFMVLLVRQLIIMLLVLVAPFAIACYILPNTQKVFTFWKDTFISMLVAFPIISAMIAVGRVFALVAYNNTGVPALLSQIEAFAAFFLPYFLLPFAFKLAGGAIGSLSGMINDRGRGGFDRLSKFRQGKAAGNIERMKAGERFNGQNPLSKGFNRATFRAGTKNFGFGAKGRDAMTERASLLAAQHAKSDHGIAAQYNDNLLRAQSYASESEAKKNMARDFNLVSKVDDEDITKYRQKNSFARGMSDDRVRESIAQDTVNSAVTAAKANGGFGQARQIYATKQLAATGTGYDDVGQMAQAIARASGGRESAVQDMVGSMRGAAKQSGRIDLGGAGHGTVAKLATKSMEAGGARPSEDAMDAVLIEAARSTDNATLVRGKPTSTAQMTAAMGRQLEKENKKIADVNTVNVQAARDSAGAIAAKLHNIKDATRYGHETGAEAFYEGTGKDGTAGRGYNNPATAEQVKVIAESDVRAVTQTYKDQRQSPINPDDPRGNQGDH